MGRVWLVVLAACGGSPPPAPALKNVAPHAARPVETSPCGIANFAGRDPGNFYGAVCDPEVHEWLNGVTAVATGSNLSRERVVLGNEHGVYAMQLAPGDYTITYYFSDCRWVRHHHVDAGELAPIYDRVIQNGCR